MTDDSLPPDEADEALAAEYAMGLLTQPEWARVSARLARDPAFAARVAAWENRLSALNDAYPEAEAPAEVLSRVEARLFPAPARRSWFARFWAMGAAATAVLALAFYLTLAPANPDLMATLTAVQGGLTFQALVSDGQMTITRIAGPAPDASYSLELWLIVGEAAPVSLGLLTEASQTLPLPDAAPGQTLAISQEPPGGSPGDAPTGPILAAAPLSDA